MAAYQMQTESVQVASGSVSTDQPMDVDVHERGTKRPAEDEPVPESSKKARIGAEL
jgi:hypothetical protein